MRSKNKPVGQLQFLAPALKERLNPKNELYLLAHAADRHYFEKEFAPLYSEKGRPAHPVRLMVSLLIIKAVYNLSGEALVEQHWEMNPYTSTWGAWPFNSGDSPVRPAT